MDNEAFEKFIEQDFSAFTNWINTMNAYEFTAIATGIAFLIAPTLTINQQNSLGNFFEQIGQVLLTIGAQNVTVKHKQKQNSGIKHETVEEDLKEEIEKLKKEVIQLRKDSLNNNRQ